MNAQKKHREPTIFLICDSNCVRLRKTRTEAATLSKAATEATLAAQGGCCFKCGQPLVGCKAAVNVADFGKPALFDE